MEARCERLRSAGATSAMRRMRAPDMANGTLSTPTSSKTSRRERVALADRDDKVQLVRDLPNVHQRARLTSGLSLFRGRQVLVQYSDR